MSKTNPSRRRESFAFRVFSLSLSEPFFVCFFLLLGSDRNMLTRWGTMRTEREGTLSGIRIGRYYCEISASTYLCVHVRPYRHPDRSSYPRIYAPCVPVTYEYECIRKSSTCGPQRFTCVNVNHLPDTRRLTYMY